MNIAQPVSYSASHQPTRSASPRTRSVATIILYLLTIAAAIGTVAGAVMGLFLIGPDADQGNVQRIFYFHVPSFSGAAVAFAATVIGGLAYLKTRNPKWDALALAGVEVGLMLSVITLVTGMTWARPIWNTWWTWDPRLTSAAIMALTYAAYLMLRSGIENPDKRRLFASVYGILAISTVIFTTVIIRIRPDTIHPTVIGPSATNAEGGFAMTVTIGAVLGVSSFVWCCLLTPALMWWRMRLEAVIERTAALRSQTL